MERTSVQGLQRAERALRRAIWADFLFGNMPAPIDPGLVGPAREAFREMLAVTAVDALRDLPRHGRLPGAGAPRFRDTATLEWLESVPLFGEV